MKVKVYRIYAELPGATVWETADVDLPLRTVLKRNIVSITGDDESAGQDPFIADGSDDVELMEDDGDDFDFPFDTSQNHKNMFIPRPLSFNLRQSDTGVARTVMGVVTATSTAGLINFAINNLVPGTSGSRVEKLIASLRAGAISEGEVKVRLESMVESGDSDLSGEWPLFKVKKDTLKEYTARLSGGGTVLVNRSKGRMAIFLEDTIRVGTSDMPRNHFIIHTNDGIASWDGVKWHRLRADEAPPAGLVSRLEKRGKTKKEMEIYDAPLCDMEPVFFVRVPFSKELRKAGRPQANAHKELLSRPWFMVDTRRAIPMPPEEKLGEMPVITDPAEALYILRRLTGRNVYIPGKTLMMDEDVRTSDRWGRETFLAGCLPMRI